MNKTIMNTILVGFIVIMLLSGCTGLRMNPPVDVPGVAIVPITANLIQELTVDRNRPRIRQVNSDDIPNQQEYHYLIGARDVLSIVVWDHPELTIPAGQFRSAESTGHLVSEDGTIFYPHVGTLDVAGKTLTQIRESLTEKISGFIQNPQLDVRIAGFRSQNAYILGQVKTPGPQPITDIPLTVVRALGLSDGVTPEADLTGATLTRNEKLFPIDLLAVLKDGKVDQNMVLRDGDILHIPDQNFRKIYVMGELYRQVSVLIGQNRRSISLTEALAEAGGVDQVTSNPGRIYVARGNPNKPGERTIYHLDAESPDALVLGEHFQLQPRDLVFVGTAGVTRWSRVISQLLPSQLTGAGRIAATGI